MADLAWSAALSVTLCPDLNEWTRHTLFVCGPLGPTPQPATLRLSRLDSFHGVATWREAEEKEAM